jgi:Uri superfamily endonuclease
VEKVIGAETIERIERSIAQSLLQSLRGVLGFGCSDCRCSSHLFFSADLATLERLAIETFNQQNLDAIVLSGK